MAALRLTIAGSRLLEASRQQQAANRLAGLEQRRERAAGDRGRRDVLRRLQQPGGRQGSGGSSLGDDVRQRLQQLQGAADARFQPSRILPRKRPAANGGVGYTVGVASVQAVETPAGDGLQISAVGSGAALLIEPPPASITRGLSQIGGGQTLESVSVSGFANTRGGPKPYGSTSAFNRQEGRGLVDRIEYQYVVLPAGGDTAVICVFFQRYEIKNEQLITRNSTATYTPINEDEDEFEIVVITSQSLSYAASSSTASEISVAAKAVLVSRQNVRPISVPGGLVERWRDFYPLKQLTSTSESVVPGSLGGFFFGVVEMANDSFTRLFSVSESQDLATGSDGTIDYFIFQPAMTYIEFFDERQVYDPQVSILSAVGDASGLGATTPGIYRALQGRLEVEEGLSAAELAARYLPGAPVPRFSLVRGEETEQSVRFDLTPGLLAGPFDLPPEARRIPNPRGLLPNRDPEFFWDWGQPDYCRQQLLALGFSAADLTF